MRLRDLPRDRPVWAYVVLILGMFYKPLATETFYVRDLYLLFYPKKLLFVDAIRSGRLPLWDPFTNGGQPFLALPSNFSFHPSNLLYLVLPTLFAFNLILVLHVLFCAVAAYWLARVARLSIPAAFVAGAVFAFCGYTLSSANLTPLLLGLPWVPMTIGLTHRALRDGRSIVPAGIAAAMPLLGAAAELTAMLFAILVIWVAFARSGTTMRARAIAVVIVIIAAIGLSLVQTLPVTSILAQSTRGEGRSYHSFTQWSVALERLPELVIPRFLGEYDTLEDEDYWGRPLETHGFPYILSLYVGIPALLLALFGTFIRGDAGDVPRRALAVIALTAVVLSLGRNLPPFRLIYDYVPLVSIFRYPVKAQLAMLLPVALLAACGVELLAQSRRKLAIVAGALGAALGALAIAIATNAAFTASFAGAFSFTPLAPKHQAALAIALAHAAIAALAMLFASRRAWLAAGVVTLDLVIAGYAVNDYAPRALFDEPPAAAVVRDAVGGHRFYAAEREQALRTTRNDLSALAEWEIATLQDYTASLFGIPVVYHSDYDGLAPAAISRLGGRMLSLPWEQRRGLLDRAAVAAFMTPEELSLTDVDEIARIDAPRRPLRLYRNRRATAARFVSSVVLARSDAEAMERVIASGDLTTAVVTAPLPVDNCGPAAVHLLSRSLNSARYQVDAPCRGLVVFAENHYDGWRATIDGRDVPHLRADYAFTAVPVPPGRHTIDRHYTPPGLWAGVGGTVATMLALAFLQWRWGGGFGRMVFS